MAIAIIAVAVPLVPSTPFLILAAFCFNRSSERFHKWLLHHRYFGPPIRDWDTHKVIRTQYKVIATLMVASSAVFIFTRDEIPSFGKIGFTLCVSIMLIYVWTRKSKP